MTTKTAQHTPGPWKVYIVPDSHMGTAYGINSHGSVPENEHEANARLIAAAPELLEQLEALCVQIRASGYLLVPPNVEAVIRKARGE